MKLTSTTANRHVFQGIGNGKPLRLCLSFENGQSIRLGVAGDGGRMLVDNLPLDEPFDMGEAGSIDVEDMTHSLDTRLQDGEVYEARALELDGQRVGVRLMLAGRDAFNFWVDGDELFWGDGDALAAHNWLAGLVPALAGPVQV
jgi:hypothetical protein